MVSTKKQTFLRILLAFFSLSLLSIATFSSAQAQSPNIKPDAPGDFLTFLGCNDKDKNGLDFADCLSNDSKGTVSSFTDFRGNLTAPNPKGYAAGLTQATDARTFILNIVNFALGFLGLIAVLVVIYGGFTMVTSMGGDGYGKGKKAITFAAIGLIVVMSSFALVNTILLAPSGSEKGGSSSSAINAGTIRGVAGRQRFNYLAQQIDQILLRVYNSYQFHLKVKQEIDNAVNNISSFDTNSCFTPLSDCANQLQTLISSQVTTISNNVNNSNANAVFSTNLTIYTNRIPQASAVKINAIRLVIDDEDCDTNNKIAELNPCTEQDISKIRTSLKAVVDSTTADLKTADFLQKSFEEDMNWAVAKTSEIFQSVSGLTSASIGLQFFNILIPNYAKSPTSTLPTKVAAENNGEYAKLNSAMQNQLKVGTSLGGLDQTAIKNTLKSLVEIKSILENLKFVDTVISADINQGNAPLIVNFSSVGSTDPSGFSITDDRIEWDLNGDGKFSGDPGAFTSGTDESKGLLNCSENKKAISNCIFTKAGTYRITLRIKPVSNEKNPATGLNWNQEVAPGLSYIDVLVNPPATKINLNVKPLKGGSIQSVIEYEDKTGTIKNDTNRVYFTLDQAKAGLIFDATKSRYSDGQTPLTNDPSSKVRWNFGIQSQNNDTFMVPSDKSLSIEQAYPRLGNYQVRFEVVDKNNVVDRKIFTVVVSNVAPRITNAPTTGKVGQELTFDGSESTSDGGPIIFNWKIEKLNSTTIAFLPNWLNSLAKNAHAEVNILPSLSSKTPVVVPVKALEPTKRNETNDFYSCNMPAGKDDTLKCNFKKAGEYRVTLSLDDDGTAREESTIIQISSSTPTAGFKYTKLNESAPALYKLDAAGSSFDQDETGNSNLEYSWEIMPGNCVLIGFANVTPLDELISASTDAISSQTPCEKLKEFNNNISQPVVKFTQKGDYSVNLAVRTFDEPNLPSDPAEQTISVKNILDVTWGDMKPSAILKVPGDTNTSPDQLPDEVNKQPMAEVKFIFASSQGISYDLDFGDGTNSTGEINKSKPVEVIHNYTKTGKYTANLSVFDADDIENKIARKIFIGDSDSPISIITTKVNGSVVQPENIELERAGTLENVIRVNRRDNVTFDAEQSLNTDGTGRRLKYSWNINNNEKQSTAKQVSHNFSQISDRGEPYVIKLKVSNEKDATQSGEDSLNVIVVGEQPTLRSLTAVATDNELTTPVSIKLNAVGAEDTDGQIIQYKWWYYDANKVASPDERLGLQITTVPSAKIAIGTRGLEGEKPRYKFGVEITDNDNLTVSTDSQNENTKLTIPTPELQVTNGPNKAPIARFSVDRTSINVGEAVNFTSASFDPDAGGGIKDYKWDFGDGTKGENKASVSHIYQKASADGYKTKLTVVDSNSSEATSDSVKIFVDAEAQPPLAGFTVEQTPGSKTVKFTNTSKPDEASGATIKKYSWDFDVATDSNGDGKKDNDIDSGEASPSYTYPNLGIYRAKLTVEDNQGQSRSITNFVNLKPAPTVPKTVGLIDGQGENIDTGAATSASKTMGANFFEAGTKVDFSLLIVSISSYVILMLISRKIKLQAAKNK
jgi:PKD repeat protein